MEYPAVGVANQSATWAITATMSQSRRLMTTGGFLSGFYGGKPSRRRKRRLGRMRGLPERRVGANDHWQEFAWVSASYERDGQAGMAIYRGNGKASGTARSEPQGRGGRQGGRRRRLRCRRPVASPTDTLLPVTELPEWRRAAEIDQGRTAPRPTGIRHEASPDFSVVGQRPRRSVALPADEDD